MVVWAIKIAVNDNFDGENVTSLSKDWYLERNKDECKINGHKEE